MNSGNGMGSFLLGAVLGIGLGLYLNSEEGKRWRNEKLSSVSDLEAKIDAKVEEAVSAMKSKVNEAATKVKNATETNGKVT